MCRRLVHKTVYAKKLNFFSKKLPMSGTGFMTSLDAWIMPSTSKMSGMRLINEKIIASDGIADDKTPAVMEISTEKINTPRLCSRW